MSELITPYFIKRRWNNDDGVDICTITDDNGVFVFDCYESDAHEILKRINAFEALDQQLKTARKQAIMDCGNHIMQGLLSKQVNAFEFEEYANNLEGK